MMFLTDWSAVSWKAYFMAVELREFSWDRMIEAVQAARDRALRATAALEKAGIPYAMAGGNAVAAWVAGWTGPPYATRRMSTSTPGPAGA